MGASTDRLRGIGVTGVVVLSVGIALVLLSIRVLSWYAVDGNTDSAGSGFTFTDLRGNADQLGAPIASAYFDWLAVALLIALAVVGFLANLRGPASDVLRVLGFLLGVVGTAGTYYALAQLFNAQRAAGASDHSVAHNSTLGVWLALAGFLTAGAGAVLGPRRTD